MSKKFRWGSVDGNALSLVAECSKVMKANKEPKELIDRMCKEALTSDYDHVIATVCKYVSKYERDGDTDEDE